MQSGWELSGGSNRDKKFMRIDVKVFPLKTWFQRTWHYSKDIFKNFMAKFIFTSEF